jgi:hypothetical protein
MSGFDWPGMTTKIEAATRLAFTEMVEQHGSEGIYAFALYSDAGAMTVCPSTNSEHHLTTELDRVDHEWDDPWFTVFQSTLFTTCVNTLDKLKTEGFFSTVAGRDVFLVFTVSDHEFTKAEMKTNVARLNDNPYLDEYLAWMKTWS